MLLWHLLERKRGDLLGILPIWGQEYGGKGWWGIPSNFINCVYFFKLENTMNPKRGEAITALSSPTLNP